MQIRIDAQILEKFPNVQIGFLAARVTVKKHDPFVESLKQGLNQNLQGQGINATNFAAHPAIAVWRDIYEKTFLMKPKTYRSSIESLLKRVVTGKELWTICNVVDLYNCCSILSLLPIGGYDLRKISGDIQIRFGKTAENFRGLGEKESVSVQPHHVVYADAKRILCWLWNHKDSAETFIDEATESVIFFIDSFDLNEVQSALKQLSNLLEKIGCTPLESGILNQIHSQTELNYVVHSV
jgi:DNA/RNA-binding domain of Phe-tRNA-synthetase-like protein